MDRDPRVSSAELRRTLPLSMRRKLRKAQQKPRQPGPLVRQSRWERFCALVLEALRAMGRAKRELGQ